MNLTAPIFTDADKAREHLEATRWPHGPICPHCGVVNEATALQGKAHRAGLYQCNACREQFTVTVGTVFERSKVPLNKWLLATYLMSSSKKGISAHQIGRTLGVTYKTAWFMCHRIREAMGDNGAPMGGEGVTVEADESVVGGKERNKRLSKRPTGGNGVVRGQPSGYHGADASVGTPAFGGVPHDDLGPKPDLIPSSSAPIWPSPQVRTQSGPETREPQRLGRGSVVAIRAMSD